MNRTRSISLRNIGALSGGFSILAAALFALFTDVSLLGAVLIGGMFVLVTLANLLVGLGYQQAIQQFSEADRRIEGSHDP